MVLEKQVVVASMAPSYTCGAKMLKTLCGIGLTSRGLNKTAHKIGMEMVTVRDARIEDYFSRPLSRRRTKPATPIELACVSIDGGRMQTRREWAGLGVYDPHWRETKNGLFSRMTSNTYLYDPHPELPRCFADPKQMRTLLSGIGDETTTPEAAPATVEPPDKDWRPEQQFRTCISSLKDSDTFGRMMEVEADSRGFYQAQKKAFVGDGLAYNWTIQERHFRDFTAILDFVHVVERCFAAARCLHVDSDAQWADYLRWARACWQGRAAEVIAELKQRQAEIGPPPPDCDKSDPRQIFAEAIGYLENNASRMNYPEYRRNGLPTTSAHMESLVKEMNYRVKGTEKFWNDGDGGEAILQLRAAALCHDDRLHTHIKNRPGHPYHPNVKHPPLATAN